MSAVEVVRGDSPVILGLPHTGTFVPEDVASRLTPRGRCLSDTDWHVERLYDALLPGATTVRATFHRYVVDANRDPSGASLYPGQNTTGLVPLTDFDGRPLWIDPPTDAEIEARRNDFHGPYHAALAAEIDHVRARHGTVLLFDCHSIRSWIPHLFDGTLPDLNIGTDGSNTCAPAFERCLVDACRSADGYTSVLNGRFRGGWTTRHYANPQDGVHAIQLELAQSTYLVHESAPFDYDSTKAERLRTVLRDALYSLAELALSQAPSPTSPDENPPA